MQAIRFATNYLLYYLKALDEHSLHSPLVFDLYTNVINSSLFDQRYNLIEKKRAELLMDQTMLSITDFGAGSSQKRKKQRKVSSIAKKSIAPPKKSQLLHRLINYYQPKNIIELGTCLGINTLYLALNENSNVFTFDGCKNSIALARNTWQGFDFAKKIKVVEGNINQTLPGLLAGEVEPDFVFMDANHTYEATIKYFDLLSAKAHNNSIIVIDDIHWSSDMQKAWQEIKMKDKVFLSIDMFQLGIVLFKPLYLKQHYMLEY